MANKIFYIGLSRSGTTSLHQVLTQLGLNSRHFPFELYMDNDYSTVNEADAFGDSPIPKIYKDLDKRFPNSKFILTIRNKKSWLDSMKWMFKEGKVVWWWGYHIHKYHKEFYGSRDYSEILMSKKYDQYHADVYEYFEDRPNDLLILNLDEGIDVSKICSFLRLTETKIVFPKSNSRQFARLRKRVLYKIFSAFLFSYQTEQIMRRAMKVFTHLTIF